MSLPSANTDAPILRLTARSKEYFVPREGISWDVISADIRIYLGNDALVRPSNYIVCDERTVLSALFLALIPWPYTC